MDKLKQNEREIIKLIREGKQTVSDFMEYLNVSRVTINVYTMNLVNRGFLIQSTKQPRGHTHHNIYELSLKLRGITVKHD